MYVFNTDRILLSDQKPVRSYSKHQVIYLLTFRRSCVQIPAGTGHVCLSLFSKTNTTQQLSKFSNKLLKLIILGIYALCDAQGCAIIMVYYHHSLNTLVMYFIQSPGKNLHIKNNYQITYLQWRKQVSNDRDTPGLSQQLLSTTPSKICYISIMIRKSKQPVE